jgi:hypothetical protein
LIKRSNIWWCWIEHPRGLSGLTDIIPFKSMWNINLSKKEYNQKYSDIEEKCILGTFGIDFNPDGLDKPWETMREKEIRNIIERRSNSNRYNHKTRSKIIPTENLTRENYKKLKLTKEEKVQIKKDKFDNMCEFYREEVLQKE